MKKIFTISLFLVFIQAAISQPYVDPFQLRYTYALRSPGNYRGTPYTHLWAGSDIPLRMKNGNYFLLSPYYENWQLDSGSVNPMMPALHGLSFPAGIMMHLKNPKWMLTLLPVVRTNGEKLFANNTYQFGGAGFLSYEKSPGKKIRFGAYMNTEFFGFFFMPLLGADWRMDDRNYFFGLLPGRFTWEHKFNSRLYGGVTFRAITSSYRLSNGHYVRLDDNQLSGFLDIYPAKKICFTLEPGYGIFRKLRKGHENRKYQANETWGDGFFIKLSAAYRIRLDQDKK
jgi:hypothetical protein